MKNSSLFEKITVYLCIFASAAALGMFVYTQILYQPNLPDNEAELENLRTDTSRVNVSEAYKVKKLTVNLKSRRTKLRFLDLSMDFLPFKVKDVGYLEENKALINDTVIDITGKMYPEELNSVAGKILLENRIKNQLNLKFGRSVVKEIYFSHYVIQ